MEFPVQPAAEHAECILLLSKSNRQNGIPCSASRINERFPAEVTMEKSGSFRLSVTIQDLGTGMSPKGASEPWMAYQAPVRAVPATLSSKA